MDNIVIRNIIKLLPWQFAHMMNKKNLQGHNRYEKSDLSILEK